MLGISSFRQGVKYCSIRHPPTNACAKLSPHSSSFVQEQPTLARVLLFGARGDPELAAVDWKVQQEATERIASLLRDGVKSPHLSSPSHNQTLHLRAEFLKIGIHGLAEWWLHNPETPREILIDTIMDLVWPSLKILHFQDNA